MDVQFFKVLFKQRGRSGCEWREVRVIAALGDFVKVIGFHIVNDASRELAVIAPNDFKFQALGFIAGAKDGQWIAAGSVAAAAVNFLFHGCKAVGMAGAAEEPHFGADGLQVAGLANEAHGHARGIGFVAVDFQRLDVVEDEIEISVAIEIGLG